MTNQQRQSSLDKQKWLHSEEMGLDYSGGMYYCVHCQYRVYMPESDYCTIPHEQRVQECACAKAYNRMVRGTNRKCTKQ